MGKKPRACVREMLGILNPYGDIWTTSTFETHESAQEYLRNFWLGMEGEADLDRFQIVPVVVRVSVAKPKVML